MAVRGRLGRVYGSGRGGVPEYGTPAPGVQDPPSRKWPGDWQRMPDVADILLTSRREQAAAPSLPQTKPAVSSGFPSGAYRDRTGDLRLAKPRRGLNGRERVRTCRV